MALPTAKEPFRDAFGIAASLSGSFFVSPASPTTDRAFAMPSAFNYQLSIINYQLLYICHSDDVGEHTGGGYVGACPVALDDHGVLLIARGG